MVKVSRNRWKIFKWLCCCYSVDKSCLTLCNGMNCSRPSSSVLHSLSVSQLYLTLCDPMACSPPGSSVHGYSQARKLEWVAMFSSRESSQPRDQTQVSQIAGVSFTIWVTKEVHDLSVCSNSYPLSRCCYHSLQLPSPPALNLSQHQDLFQWVSSSICAAKASTQWVSSFHQVAKVLEL